MTIQRNLAPDTGAVAVSLLCQSDTTTAAALARAWPTIDKSVIVGVDPFRKIMDNRASVSGNREPDIAWMGNIDPFDLPFSFPEANADILAWINAFLLGDPDAASQIGTKGIYNHVANMININNLSRPLFTACLRRGDETNGIDKLLLYGLQAQSGTISFNRNEEAVKATISSQATGQYKRNILREIVYASSQATSLTLTTKAVEGDDAAGRLKSIHDVKACLNGINEKNWKECTPTAASDATPCEITIPKTWSAIKQVYSSVGSTLTDYTDGSSTIVWDISDTDYVMIGLEHQANAFLYTSSVANNEAATTIDIEYLKSDGEWTNIADVLDNSASGGITLAKTGHIHFNLPTDWIKTTQPVSNSAVLGIKKRPLFWLKIKASAAIRETTAGTIALSTYENAAGVKFSDNGSFTDYDTEASSFDGSEFPAANIETADYIYFRAKGTSCAGAYIEMGDTVNDAASVMTVEYYNGSWVDLSVAHAFDDGTDVAGDTLKQSGLLSWTQPTDHELVTIDSEEGYWFRISVSVNLDAGAAIEGLKVADRYIPFEVIYRAKESVDFSEWDAVTDVTEVIQIPFIPAKTQFFINPDFDGTRMTSLGWTPNCELISGELNFAANNPAPTRCMDGTGTRYATKHVPGNPQQTVKLVVESNRANWELFNDFTDENTGNSTTESVRYVSLGVRFESEVIKTLYPQIVHSAEYVFPKCYLKMRSRGETDGRYSTSLEFEVMEDTVNGYRSVYSNVVTDISTNYGATA